MEKVEQIQRSEIWENLKDGKLVWLVRFYCSSDITTVCLNHQNVNYVNNVVAGEDESELFFRMVEES
jgi:hypothetical protein